MILDTVVPLLDKWVTQNWHTQRTGDEKVEAHNLSFAYANFESPTYPEEALQCQVSLSRRLMVDLEANTIEFIDQEPYGLMV